MLTLNKKNTLFVYLCLLAISFASAQYYNFNSAGTYNSNNYYAGYNNNYYNGAYNAYNSGYNTHYGSGYSPYVPNSGSGYTAPYTSSGYRPGFNTYSSGYSPYATSSGIGYNTYGYGGTTNYWQTTSPGLYNSYGTTSINNYWPNYRQNLQQCNGATTDFLVMIPPGACTPNVVRSDLLAEQNVPVFCKISTLKINPLIDVSAIQSISFSGSYPEGVSGVSYHPPRQGVRSYNTLLGSDISNDAGYVVITLSRQPDERELQRFVEGNLTARIRYDARHLYGTGQAEYFLEADHGLVPFWNGKGFLEVTDVNNGFAQVNLYTRRDAAPYRRLTLQAGQASELIFFPGYYCSAGVRIRLNSVVSPADMALLNIDGDKIWVREGSKFLDNKCYVQRVNVYSGGSGTVDVTCAGKRMQLELQGKGPLLYNGLDTREYPLESRIDTSDGNTFYVAYMGENAQNNFVVLTTKPVDQLDIAFLHDHFSRDLSALSPQEFEASIGESIEGKSRIGLLNQDYFILYPGSLLGNLQYAQTANNLVNSDKYGVDSEMNTLEGITRELVNFYPTEEKIEGTYWGEEALFQQIVLAGQTGHIRTQNDLIDVFENTYPGSDLLEAVLNMKKNSQSFDYENAGASVQVNNEFFSIFVESFRAQKDLDKSATIKVGGRSAEFVRENDEIEFDDGSLYIEKIDVTGVTFRFDPKQSDAVSQGKFIPLNAYGLLGGREIEVREVNSRKVAYVSVEPQLQKTYSEASFAFKIGVEKRDIELNPDKTKEAIEGLNQTIAEWEDMLDRLGKVISVWKATCFATSSILMLETMLAGFDGESLARQKVMKNYKVICDTEIGKGTYNSRTECYNALSSNIDNEVDKMSTAINAVNAELKQVQSGNVQTTGLLGKGQITNQTKYVEDLKRQLQWEGVDVNGVKVTTQDLTKSTEVSSVLLYQKLGCNVNTEICNTNPGQNVACCSAYEEMTAGLQSAAIQKRANEEGKKITDNIKKIVGGSGNPPAIQSVNSPNVRTLTWNGQTGSEFTNLPSDIGNDDKVQFLNVNSQTYVIKLRESTLGGSMGIEAAYILNSNDQWERVTDLTQNGLDGFVFIGGSEESCKNNVMKNPEVRFYETGSNQGLPGIVPFDVQNGWYAYVPSSQGVLIDGTQQSYTAAGDVNFFWICNAGKNGVIEQKSGDDLCQSFSANQVGFNTFIACGIEGREVGELYAKARDAIRQAALGYGRRGYIDILGNNIKAGQPVSNTGGSECQDFMSPKDCKLLFNACDPVICPSSRCDLGGKYPVSDVVQTGIIGSMVLCLPNAREGILFPVCLTGIHAGIDAFVSILKSEQQCLQHNLDNGEYIGICDEITAIYTCEFFWRNFGSILDALLPSFFENLFGQPTVRGGGEYLNVQSAWQNLGKSMEFFTGFYAENAVTAFQLRNSQNIGTEVCNGFLGTSVPFGLTAEGADALLAPQSPSQFYAYFSEIPFTSATSPATSHYKVYYHIYAGNDFGASYQVYLRNPSVGGFYAVSPVANVKTGFIARGQSADEAIDFTGPAGYKELCVRINNQEECGFGTVGSSFAVDYATQKYAEDQATQTDITTESQCTSTSSSAWGLVSPNVQAGVETAIGGRDINLIGITRVCSTANPSIGIAQTQNTVICTSNTECGSGYTCQKVAGSDVGNCVDRSGTQQQSLGRWIDVGYCGDPNLRCWLDSATLQDRFNAIDAVNQEIYGESGTVIDHLKYGQLFDELQTTYEDALRVLSEQYNKIIELTPQQLRTGTTDSEISSILQELDSIIGVYSAGVGTANNKAQALALKATIYRMIIEQKVKDNADYFVTGETPNADGTNSFEIVDYENGDYANSLDTQTNTVVPPTAQFNTRSIDGKYYIYFGDIQSSYYIQNNLIFKEQALTDSTVGRINNGVVLINQDQNAIIGSQTLGSLNGLSYTEGQGFS